MFVVALNRKKILTSLRLGLMLVAVLMLIIVVFGQLEKRVSLDSWQAANDHPGRVLRVNFEEETTVVGRAIEQVKEYYRGSN